MGREWSLGIMRVVGIWFGLFLRSESLVPVSSLGLAHPSSVYYIGLCFCCCSNYWSIERQLFPIYLLFTLSVFYLAKKKVNSRDGRTRRTLVVATSPFELARCQSRPLQKSTWSIEIMTACLLTF